MNNKFNCIRIITLEVVNLADPPLKNKGKLNLIN